MHHIQSIEIMNEEVIQVVGEGDSLIVNTDANKHLQSFSCGPCDTKFQVMVTK
jgi:hypothetical protein